jgi:perosamine synthetase
VDMSTQVTNTLGLPPSSLQPGEKIFWAVPPVGEEEANAAREAVAATSLSMGSRVREFEQAMADYAGRRHAIGVSNGTDALEVATRMLGIGAGDEVIVSSLSYIATVNCIVRAGAVPVFADVRLTDLNIDPASAQSLISPRTKALMLSDYCGFPVAYDELISLADQHGLSTIVDGAQAIGTFFSGRPALGFGTVSTTSFHAAKLMTAGEGGMVFVDDDRMDERCRRFRGQGEVPGRKYIHDTLGFNHRLTDVQAAIGLVQFQRLQALCDVRHRIAEAYLSAFDGRADIQTLAPPPNGVSAWFSFPILVPDRDGVVAALNEANIETRSLYPIPTYGQGIPEYPSATEPRPVAELAAASVINLPVHHAMSDELVEFVADHVIRAVG